MSSPADEENGRRAAADHAEFERIEPLGGSPRFGSPDAARGEAPSPRPRSRVVAIGLATLLAALAWVFFVLPSRVPDRATSRAPEPPSAPPAAPAPDLESGLTVRAEVDALARTLAERRAELAERSHASWDPAGADALERAAARAGEALDERDFSAAIAFHREAIASAERSLAASDGERRAAIEEGERAIREGDSRAATSAFGRALAIAPGDEVAGEGLRRAGTLDEVNDEITAAREHERTGELDAARASARAALALDGKASAAADILARVDAAIAERDFRAHVSRGLRALASGDASAARAAYRRAEAIRPGAPEVADGLARATVAIETSAVAELRDRALGLEATERWEEAAAAYREALAVDGTLAFAREGEARAAARATLSSRMSEHLTRPERLASSEVRDALASLLDEARDVREPGPRHRAQVDRLRALLDAARTKVPVRLASDEETEVLVHRVGRLGRFSSKEIELTPGTYTVVGRRRGFRDVRVEVRVVAGEGPVGPVVVRCEEPI